MRSMSAGRIWPHTTTTAPPVAWSFSATASALPTVLANTPTVPCCCIPCRRASASSAKALVTFPSLQASTRIRLTRLTASTRRASDGSA